MFPGLVFLNFLYMLCAGHLLCLPSNFIACVQPLLSQCHVLFMLSHVDYKMVLSTWGMMYCGGSKAVEDTLVKISKEYSISLHPESFAW